MAVDLTPHAFITPDELKAHLGRSVLAESDIADRLANSINSATGWLEEWTKRALKVRNHKRQVTTTITGTTGTSNPVAASVSGIDEGDDVFGASGIAFGTLVASISGSTVNLSEDLSATLTDAEVSFGSEPLIVSGNGTNSILIPEWPVHELFGVYGMNGDGTRTALDLTGARISKAGTLVLPSAVFADGELNIEIECRAGYAPRTATGLGDVSYLALRRLAFRLGEMFFLDDKLPMGRVENFSVGSFSSNRVPAWVPSDVAADVLRFMRLA